MFPEKRARKKKSLTDPVTLIPFPNQSVRPENTAPQYKASVHPEKPIPQVKSEPQTLREPVGNLKTQHLSIKQMLNQSEENQQTSGSEYRDRPKSPFTLDQVKMIWKQYAFKMKEEGFDTIYYALTKRDPKIYNETEIHQEFDNQVQVDTLQANITDMLDFVREKLNNWTLTLFFDVNTHQEENTRLLTGKDKFEALAKKNANLHSFLKTFNLDIDY